MKKATPIFRRGDVVRVPFPFVDDNRRRYRPGLVVSNGPVGGEMGLLWVVMITGAGHEPWPDDVDAGPEHSRFGLPIPSRIRTAKIATIMPNQASVIGRLDSGLLAMVMDRVRAIIGDPPAKQP